MPTSIPLVTGVAGAIGCAYLRSVNQLIFVEFGGNIASVDLSSRSYTILGTGYTALEDIAVSADGTTAWVTERSGNLLRVNLSSADRSFATVVVAGLTAPHQIALDEDHDQAYVAEFANPGRLWRINLTTGAQTTIVNNLAFALGLLMTADGRFAYVSEQTSDGKGKVSRIEVSTGRREELVRSATAPIFFLRWNDAGEGAIVTTERDPADQILLIDLTQRPVSARPLVTGVPARPSGVAVTAPNRLLVCSDNVVSELDLTEGIYTVSGPLFLGIGHVPCDRIVDGYANTTVDPGYFFQVQDAPFGGTLPLMINHERARAMSARYYPIVVDGVVQSQSWNDYRWDNVVRRFVLQTNSVLSGTYFRVREAGDIWYNAWLGYLLNSAGLTNGLHDITVKLFRSRTSLEMATASCNVMIDNRLPTAAIEQVIYYDPTNPDPTRRRRVVGACAIVEGTNDEFGFLIQAADPEEHLKIWQLSALWGDNHSVIIAADSYASHASPTRHWAGIHAEVPAAPWHATQTYPGTGIVDPMSRRCAHTFYLGVWDRVINGWEHLHYTVTLGHNPMATLWIKALSIPIAPPVTPTQQLQVPFMVSTARNTLHWNGIARWFGGWIGSWRRAGNRRLQTLVSAIVHDTEPPLSPSDHDPVVSELLLF